jgi:2-polyprenyl-3-methyl-5-hydroxy-6-metoxy-1,4-benzoquinol methylase
MRGMLHGVIRPMPLLALLVGCVMLAHGLAQTEGRAALEKFQEWKRLEANAGLDWGDALTRYRQELIAHGAGEPAADRTIRLIVAYDEATLYNKIYAGTPEFNTKPNRLLVEAVEGLRPGKALDVDMGQGRNAIYLASRGWDVTGFDVADVGLEKARAQAAAAGVKITAVHASDDEFDFGRERWDLIAIIYALEKRSVLRVRDALEPGGLVVVEAGHTDKPDLIMEYQSNELLKIFEGFRILKYEETVDTYDWGPDTIRLVRLVAQKPR